AEVELNDVKLMDTKTVSELISIIDRVATVEVDYAKSYNCLGMAKILCRIIGDSLRADYFQGRMDLIDIVRDFNATDKIDSDRLKEIESARGDLIAANSSLSEAFKNLKAVSFMGHPEHKMELIKMHTESRSSMLRDLAGLVLTYNGLLEAGMEEVAEPVQQKIRESLRLKARVSTRKYYGSLKETESSDVEFKTSLIIPPGTCKADPKTQTTTILMEICAFLNSENGGTLYLGVDDDGFEAGLEDDLSDKMFDRNKDKYRNYLGNIINTKLGGEADHLVTMDWDTSEDVKKDVLIVSIKEAMNPISLDGVYYERRGARKCVVSDDYRETFLVYRQESAQKRRAEIGEIVDPAKNAAQKSGKKTAKKTETKAKTSELPSQSQLAPDLFCLSYEPVGHIGISDKTYKVSDDPIWDEKYINLPVSEDLQRNGWLILTHDNGTVSKVSLADLMGKDRNRDANFGVGVKNIFVATAMNNDLIVIRYTDSHEKDCIRVSPISMIEPESMTGTGESLFDLEISSVIGCDVIPSDKIPAKLRIFDDQRQPGVPTSCDEGKKIQKKLKDIGIKI
ncbi:MAG: ATP-binding protein, partial [Bacteroidales bacterium]|nr:ATP-binding protein [Bacteroidales bacterium]